LSTPRRTRKGLKAVAPAKAGAQFFVFQTWIPAFAGMTI
jgi:hypothetical protein